MKSFSVLFFLSSVGAALAVEQDERQLRSGSTSSGRVAANGSSDSSSCNRARNQNQCFKTVDDATGSVCEWCVAGAIPSECMSAEQAVLLPTAVFECSAPSGQRPDTNHNIKNTPFPGHSFTFDSSEIFGYTQTYSLLAKSHTDASFLNDDEPPQPAASDLCDASSKSLSGYMDIQGSEYDSSGENKHLFYWMFEKRGNSADANTPVSIVSSCCQPLWRDLFHLFDFIGSINLLLSFARYGLLLCCKLA